MQTEFLCIRTLASGVDNVGDDGDGIADGDWLPICIAGQSSVAGSSQVTVPSSHEPSVAAGGSSGGGGDRMSAASCTAEQIAVTLLRLQQDMNNVLVRLQSLETLTQQQANVLLGLLCYVNICLTQVLMLNLCC